MGFVNSMMKAVDVLIEDESVEKGNDFENYVKHLFDIRYFTIEQWSTDINRMHDIIVELETTDDCMRFFDGAECILVLCSEAENK